MTQLRTFLFRRHLQQPNFDCSHCHRGYYLKCSFCLCLLEHTTKKKYHTNYLCTNIWMHFLYFYHLVACRRASLYFFEINLTIGFLLFSFNIITRLCTNTQQAQIHLDQHEISNQFRSVQAIIPHICLDSVRRRRHILFNNNETKKNDTVFVYKEVDRRWHLFSKGKCKQRKYTLKIFFPLNLQYQAIEYDLLELKCLVFFLGANYRDETIRKKKHKYKLFCSIDLVVVANRCSVVSRLNT